MYFRLMLGLGITLLFLVSETSAQDTASAPSDGDSELRFEFVQREEGEGEPPLDKPAFLLMNQPCFGWNIQAACTLFNPEAQRELFFFTSSADVGGATLVGLSVPDNAAMPLQLPGTGGAWALAPMQGERLVIGTYYDGALHILNLRQWAVEKTIDIPGEAYVWNLTTGADGKIYGGTHPGGKLIALHPETLELESCGSASPPNRFLHHVSPLPNGQLLCHFGTEAPMTLIYDPSLKTFSETPETLSGIHKGALWNGYFVSGDRAFDNTLNRVTPPPFPTPNEKEGAWRVDDVITTQDALFLRQANRCFRYHAGGASLEMTFDIDLRGGQLMAASVSGGVYGIRGQQYFFISPGDTAITRKNLEVVAPIRIPAFLRVDDNNQVWGAPAACPTSFFMDGETGVYVSLGSAVPTPGRIYDIAFHENRTYGVSHPTGDIFMLDIQAPWDEWNGNNPRIIASMAKKGYTHPLGGLWFSESGKLYSGWGVKSGACGGAVAITDTETGSTRLHENPLGKQALSGMTKNDSFLFLGTTSGGNDIPEQPDAAPQLGVLDLNTLQPYWNHVFKEMHTVNRLLFNAHANRLAFTVDDGLRIFDPENMRVEPPLSPPPPTVTSSALTQRKDAYLYYGHERSLIRLHLETGNWENVLELPDRVGALAANKEGMLFAACGPDIYRIAFPKDW